MYIVILPKNENDEEFNIMADEKKYVILFENIKGILNYLFIN